MASWGARAPAVRALHDAPIARTPVRWYNGPGEPNPRKSVPVDLNTLQSWLWRAACTIRGEVDAARYKDYILPLIFYKRLDDVYAEELAGLAQAWGMSAAEAEPFLAERILFATAPIYTGLIHLLSDKVLSLPT